MAGALQDNAGTCNAINLVPFCSPPPATGDLLGCTAKWQNTLVLHGLSSCIAQFACTQQRTVCTPVAHSTGPRGIARAITCRGPGKAPHQGTNRIGQGATVSQDDRQGWTPCRTVQQNVRAHFLDCPLVTHTDSTVESRSATTRHPYPATNGDRNTTHLLVRQARKPSLWLLVALGSSRPTPGASDERRSPKEGETVEAVTGVSQSEKLKRRRVSNPRSGDGPHKWRRVARANERQEAARIRQARWLVAIQLYPSAPRGKMVSVGATFRKQPVSAEAVAGPVGRGSGHSLGHAGGTRSETRHVGRS